MISAWIDISMPLREQMKQWPGDEPYRIVRDLDVANGDACTLSRISLSAHTGTHVDAPLHLFADGASMDELSFDALIGTARVIELDELESRDIRTGERILLRTPNASGSLTKAAAESLAAKQIRCVGIDSQSIDDPLDETLPAHRVLLAAGVWIVENLQLDAVSPGDYEFICLPLRIAGAEGAPARAILRSAI